MWICPPGVPGRHGLQRESLAALVRPDRDPVADRPWYPSARLFRQPRLGDWDAVIDQVEQTLRHGV
jgi:hypothetical protein